MLGTRPRPPPEPEALVDLGVIEIGKSSPQILTHDQLSCFEKISRDLHASEDERVADDSILLIHLDIIPASIHHDANPYSLSDERSMRERASSGAGSPLKPSRLISTQVRSRLAKAGSAAARRRRCSS